MCHGKISSMILDNVCKWVDGCAAHIMMISCLYVLGLAQSKIVCALDDPMMSGWWI